MDLPPQPDLGHFKDDPTYKEMTEIFQDLHFDINLLIEEDLLFFFLLWDESSGDQVSSSFRYPT